MSRDRLVNRIIDLHRWTGDPFGVFAAEALRAIGVPVRESPPAEEDAVEDVHEAVALWLAMAAEAEPFADVLGPVYSEVASRGKVQRAGQFFTPWEVSVMIAELQLRDWEPRPNPSDPDGRWRILEPACGSGAMLLASLDFVRRRHGPDALRLWGVEAWDVDLTCARTCALQLLANLAMEDWALGELLVICGDSLRMEIRHIVAHAEAAPLAGASPAEAPAPTPARAGRADITLPRADQLSLFDTEDAA
ncbi:MAG TPA: N-6 DNA methylase [Longimicrobiales bacterium]